MDLGAAFKEHFDSRHRWGETVVGVTLGQAGVIYFEVLIHIIIDKNNTRNNNHNMLMPVNNRLVLHIYESYNWYSLTAALLTKYN